MTQTAKLDKTAYDWLIIQGYETDVICTTAEKSINPV